MEESIFPIEGNYATENIIYFKLQRIISMQIIDK